MTLPIIRNYGLLTHQNDVNHNKEVDVATKQKKAKKLTVKTLVILPETRQALMLMAKDNGIKNFRVLNKEELKQVLADGVTADQVEQVVSVAVARWKAGWGSRKAKS